MQVALKALEPGHVLTPISDEKEIHKEKEKEKEKPKKDPAVLRKRTSSSTDVTTRSPPVGSSAAGMGLKPGKSILEQIGTPDHNGWMRKKSENYNTWKLRYFVLKGPHLYCLKSNDRTVCPSHSRNTRVRLIMLSSGNQNQGIHQHRRLQGRSR